jgi:hypothetical protein
MDAIETRSALLSYPVEGAGGTAVMRGHWHLPQRHMGSQLHRLVNETAGVQLDVGWQHAARGLVQRPGPAPRPAVRGRGSCVSLARASLRLDIGSSLA